MATQKIFYTFEDHMTGNKSRTISFEVEVRECAVMIAQDRASRAAELDIPVDQVKPRSAQEIVDDGWRAEQNSAHGFYRQDGRKKSGGYCSLDAAIESGIPEPVDPLMLTPEDAVIEDEQARERAAVYTQLKEALGGLTERQREIVTLVYFKNCSVTEAARCLGVSKPAVSKQLKAAISNLRKTMVNKPGLSGSASESSTQNSLLSPDVSTKKGR